MVAFMAAPKQHWLVKQEPSAYSWDDFQKEKSTAWTGIRNYQARNHLAEMKRGDRVLFYHSVKDKAVVGTASVEKTAFPDETTEDPRWIAVQLKIGKPMKTPVTLETIKEEPQLKNIGLIKQSRLSVMPLSQPEYQRILEMGGLA